ncbi:MAG TPA: tetratricopeptide repeat protein [Nitrospiraceae bacterium]|nr:tetratricopeptide repeat protein [Nitrospiraceae bacterium]
MHPCWRARATAVAREDGHSLWRAKMMTLLLSLVCVLVSACADVEPAVTTRGVDEAAVNALRKSAEQGNATAQNRLGLLYNQGQGLPQDPMLAKQWFEKAAEQGDAGAQVNLGTLFLLGQGALESDQMALFWFRRAAEQQEPLAFAKLGFMYERGRGVPQDFIQAHMWYTLSAAQGEKRALASRDTLAKQMTPAQVAAAQQLAREWKPKPK